MPLKPLEVLKKGLKILQDQVEAKKEKLQAQLHAQKSISSLDARTVVGETVFCCSTLTAVFMSIGTPSFQSNDSVVWHNQ